MITSDPKIIYLRKHNSGTQGSTHSRHTQVWGGVAAGQGREGGGIRDALHRDAQSASSPQPPVQELSMVPRRDPMYWALPSVKAGTVLGDRSASCVNTSMDARQRDCHTRKINCLLSVVVVLKYYTFKGVSKC